MFGESACRPSPLVPGSLAAGHVPPNASAPIFGSRARLLIFRPAAEDRIWVGIVIGVGYRFRPMAGSLGLEELLRGVGTDSAGDGFSQKTVWTIFGRYALQRHQMAPLSTVDSTRNQQVTRESYNGA